ncbi:uncharacterized protein LY89DRAFT_432929 [Mollisia scopiformis]|uniref:Uncharacterized protein n=1 Tax=Mollisia scopiformis TaxID=149040 RepID=A0A194XMP9_MOLSC|nr:uncharacterized protein LY89DRAFT_432929 [Mollisia scopiformis]KUJ21406.1 hypothetical protein LY89DRAFT_432929 [Mollisia scopiformis]
MSKDKKIPSYLFEILLPSAIESLGISDSASHQNIIEVLSHCQTLGLSSELQRMTAKMTRKALEIRDEHLDSVCLPVFRLILSSKDASNILNLGPVQAMYRNVLNYYISRCVQPKPVFNQDWHRARRGCGKPRCSECKTLDEFLTSSTQSFTELRCKAQIQIHLDSQLQTAYPWREQLYETTQARGVMTVKKIPTEFNHELRVWEQRQNQAKKVLLSFEQGSLKVVLGDAFGIIMSLQTLHFDHKPTPPETPAIDVTKNAPPQITNSTTSQGPASARVTPLASSNRSFVNASVGTLKTKI